MILKQNNVAVHALPSSHLMSLRTILINWVSLTFDSRQPSEERNMGRSNPAIKGDSKRFLFRSYPQIDTCLILPLTGVYLTCTLSVQTLQYQNKNCPQEQHQRIHFYITKLKY